MPPSPDDMRSLSLLSVVIPCYNEEMVIREMHDRLLAALDKVPETDLEILYIDDGSRDSTLDILRELQRNDQRVRIISFARNFGQQTALTAGIASASGDAVVLIDADLQDPPEVILEMLERWRQGTNIIYGLRSEREGESWLKIWTSNLFNRTVNRSTNFHVPFGVGEFCLIDRRVVDTLLKMPDYQGSVMRMRVAWTGFDYEMVPYKRLARFAGNTKYPFRKLGSMAADSILSFSLIPLRIITRVGCLFFGLAILGSISTLIVRLFTGAWVSGWAIFSILVLALGSIQLILIGLVGEYLGRIYIEVKQRPLYVIKERLGFVPERDAE